MSLSQHFASGKPLANPPQSVTARVAADKREFDLRSSDTGALSGFTSAVLLQPLDVLKTRVQQDSQGRASTSISGVARAIWAREGVTGLWRGTVPTLLRYVRLRTFLYSTLFVVYFPIYFY